MELGYIKKIIDDNINNSDIINNEHSRHNSDIEDSYNMNNFTNVEAERRDKEAGEADSR
jgi:hypothetical protein